MYRQGDVRLVPVDSIPAGAVLVPRDNGRVVLAYGEVTGHAHALCGVATALLELDGVRYLDVPVADDLLHEEHGTHHVEARKYLVQRQREYSPEAIRQVAD